MDKTIITVLGKDRPGIIAEVTASLYALDCNLENVNQMILQKMFSGFFIVNPPPDLTREALEVRLNADLAGSGLQIHLDTVPAADAPEDTLPEERFLITTIGPDQKGLVARITRIIADHDVNVTNLKAVFRGGDEPTANTMVYEIAITRNTDQAELFQQLRQTGATLGLDISIQHKNIFETIHRI